LCCRRQLLSPENTHNAEADARANQPEQLRRFLDAGGRVTMWPAKRQSQDLLLSYLASKFDRTREYTEREFNQLLIAAGLVAELRGDGAIKRYWRIPVETA
jgi:hypothetical protein